MVLFRHGDDGLFQWDKCCLVSKWILYNHVSSPVKGILGLFKASLADTGKFSIILLPPPPSWRDTNLTAIGHMFRFSFKCYELNQIKLSKCGASSVFKGTFLQLIHIFICFACQWMSQVFSIFKRGHTAQKHENHIQTYITATVCPQKATFNIWEFPQQLPQFQAKFHSDMPFFQVWNFLGMPQLQMELVHIKTLLNTHMCYSCIPCRHWPSRLLSTSTSINSC